MIYISGPITGNPHYIDQFAAAEKELRDAGFSVYNPAADSLNLDAGITAEKEHQAYMRRDLEIIIHEVSGVALLPGWVDSKGATVEAEVARTIGIPVKTVPAWLKWINEPGFLIIHSPKPKRLPTALEVATERADATARHDFVQNLHHRPIISLIDPEPPSAHFAVDGEKIIPLIPPYLPATHVDPICDHLWIKSETRDGTIKECPNCGSTELERN